MNIINNIVLLPDSVRCTDNASWFIKGDQHHPVILPDQPAADPDLLSFSYSRSQLSSHAVHCHSSGFNQPVSLSASLKNLFRRTSSLFAFSCSISFLKPLISVIPITQKSFCCISLQQKLLSFVHPFSSVQHHCHQSVILSHWLTRSQSVILSQTVPIQLKRYHRSQLKMYLSLLSWNVPSA